MKTLLGTKFAVRKILLLMISGIFLVGCAYQTSAVPIDFGIESRTDLNGDGKEDRVRVIDRRDAGFTTIIANVNGVDVAIKDYRGYFESTVTTGDLTGNGKADVLLKSATRGPIPVLLISPFCIWRIQNGWSIHTILFITLILI